MTGSPRGPSTTRLSLLDRSLPMHRKTDVSRDMPTKSLSCDADVSKKKKKKEGSAARDPSAVKCSAGEGRELWESKTDNKDRVVYRFYLIVSYLGCRAG